MVLLFVLIGREVVQSVVKPHGIVECFDVAKDAQSGLFEIGIGLVLRPFMFQGPEESLHHGVIVTTARATAGTGDAECTQRLLVSVTRDGQRRSDRVAAGSHQLVVGLQSLSDFVAPVNAVGLCVDFFDGCADA